MATIQEIVRCALLYRKGLTYREIGLELRINPQTVSENIRQAKDSGIIERKVHLPPEIEAAEELREIYGSYHLREVYVLPIGVSEALTDTLAKFGAVYLKKHLPDGITPLFKMEISPINDLNDGIISARLRQEFDDQEYSLSDAAFISVEQRGRFWLVTDVKRNYTVRRDGQRLEIYERAKRLAIGPGQSMLALAQAIGDEKRTGMIVSPTAASAPIAFPMSSNIIAGVVATKWQCGIQRFKPDRDQVKYADVFVFGIEDINDMQGVVPMACSATFETGMPEMEEHLSTLTPKGTERGVGFINYQPIDENGKLLPWDYTDYNEVIKPAVLKLDIIKEIAEDKERTVICIGGGKDTAEAIRAGLRGKYFNILIIDYETAVTVLGSESI